MKKTLLLAAFIAATHICCSPPSSESPPNVDTNSVKPVIMDTSRKMSHNLDNILAAQPEANQARYSTRNPKKTLEYFGVKPGMNVAELLPGSGWYSKIIIPYIGDEGRFIALDYSIDMWAKFGGFATPEFLEKKKSWADNWVQDAETWRAGANTPISAFVLESIPDQMENQIDVIFIPRAIHHLNRFDQAHLANALADMKMMLKPEGIVGIVAHRAAEDQDDGWANGDNGYMKQSTVIQIMEHAGFELADSPSEINANPKDQAKSANNDMVWRLPPTLGTSGDDPELRAQMQAIGETDRMTLKFRIKH